MKEGIDEHDKYYDKIPLECRINLVSWGNQGYIIQLPFGNQQCKFYDDSFIKRSLEGNNESKS